MVPGKFDQITEETSSEVASDRGTGRGEKGDSQERGQVRGLACQAKADEGQQSESTATSVNVTSMLLPIQAVGSPNRS